MNVQATFCATLVDEWVRCGVRHAVVSPGSRSTPLALALVRDARLATHVHHDERSAGFVALGIGKASGVPAVVLTTSGTAAVELHPAVVEASYAGVPMVVCTADRPPELQSVGAPQTIDQAHLYGRAVRWFADPGVADDAARTSWRSLAARAVAESLAPGPVHLNLPFRDPLVGEPGDLPAGRPDGAPWHAVPTMRRATSATGATRRTFASKGLIVAGAGATDDVWRLSEATGWPVLADALSGQRTGQAVTCFDALLRHAPFAESVRPDVVVRVGAPPASKVLAQWLASLDAEQVVVEPHGRWFDAERTASAVLPALPEVEVEPDPVWAASWRAAEAAARAAMDAELVEPSEPLVARLVVQAAPGPVVVSSSMPVRDVEWYGGPSSARVLANRGANGIDGVVSTAVGVALATGEPTTCLVGDVAFLHDANALLGLRERGVDLTVVVVDNRGGGIFSFLPQASALDPAVFERLFGTPHEVDLVGLARAHGVEAAEIGSVDELLPWLHGRPGVVVVRTERQANVRVHEAVHAAVAAALGG